MFLLKYKGEDLKMFHYIKFTIQNVPIKIKSNFIPLVCPELFTIQNVPIKILKEENESLLTKIFTIQNVPIKIKSSI